ncbi:hypothetical protein GJU40_10805 [Bacillus lacus]|uniref:Uncharacterized protein n=1 Tax=Metabacillus lacus TaxID=1983721 RepID=A0A7X2LYR4_9BACI|nr:hypothetical protein [Metabacillus lacus]MRX72636.1 hypothetical protein [Metabacillus lacus]
MNDVFSALIKVREKTMFYGDSLHFHYEGAETVFLQWKISPNTLKALPNILLEEEDSLKIIIRLHASGNYDYHVGAHTGQKTVYLPTHITEICAAQLLVFSSSGISLALAEQYETEGGADKVGWDGNSSFSGYSNYES